MSNCANLKLISNGNERDNPAVLYLYCQRASLRLPQLGRMTTRNPNNRPTQFIAPILLLVFLLGLRLFAPTANAQRPALAQKPQQPDEVVRVATELLQTDVTVVDKRGPRWWRHSMDRNSTLDS